jgi:iron(II)-dependent oxidoreductase
MSLPVLDELCRPFPRRTRSGAGSASSGMHRGSCALRVYSAAADAVTQRRPRRKVPFRLRTRKSDTGRGSDSTRDDLKAELEAVRTRTLQLVEPLSHATLERQHSSLMSPIAWDLGHIAAFEDLWLVRRLGRVSSEQQIEEAFDAFRTPRARRGELDIPDAGRLLRRLAETREQTLAGLERVDLDSTNPLLRDGYVYQLVRDHEAQHQETILQSILLLADERYVPKLRRPLPAPHPEAPRREFLRVPAGTFRMGAPAGGFAYDNERPARNAATGEFEIGRYPVTNREFLEFIAAGGYLEPDLWSGEGWNWRRQADLVAPGGWRPRGASAHDPAPSADAARDLSRDEGLPAWNFVSGLGEAGLEPDAPVIHVCYWEAEAFARFAGARLPTEAEWEKAAAFDPGTGRTSSFPWGDGRPDAERANLDQLRFGTAAVTAFPNGRSALGCWAMIGDVWEWTDSEFRGYPGFRAFPYDEYSAVFFGPDYRVLRGGSWATRGTIARNSFRNWDYPIRRQIFSGLRLARDV